MLFALVLFALAVPQHVHGNKGSCKLTLQKDLDPNEPLVLEVYKGNLEIATPGVEDDKGVVTVQPGKELLLACLGRNNAVRGSGGETAHVKCDRGILKMGTRRATQTSMSCTQSFAKSSVQVTDITCGSGDNTGVEVQLGFQVSKEWIPLVNACHDLSRSSTLYVRHSLHGQSLQGAIKSNERRTFTKGPRELFSSISPDSLYTKKREKEVFKRILGYNAFINDTSYLARGHLAPDADFIYNSGQLLTYYYVNVAPQWQDFNAGNWLAVEKAVRDLSIQVDDTLNVYTGTYGVLKLASAKGDRRMMYLEPTKKLIPVPEIFWKVVHYGQTCIAIVGHNNVFLSRRPSFICSPVTPHGWPSLVDLQKGYTYYCDYESFKNTVTYAPLLKCKSLLEFVRS